MDMKSAAKSLVKGLVTVGIFVGLFAEFGGGPVAVSKQSVMDGTAFYQDSPDMPGIVGKIQAKFTGKAMPDPVPLPLAEVCANGAKQKGVYVQTADGKRVTLKTMRHCEADSFSLVMADKSASDMTELASVPGDQVYLLSKGFQFVDIDFRDLWKEVTSVSLAVFLPWFVFAMLIKLVGIFANVYRWKVLLDAQGVHLSFRWLNRSYWIGRYWGIVTPSTMGLDGWRLIDSIRETEMPIECTTALAVERLVGFVGLIGAIFVILPFAQIGGEEFQAVVQGLKIPVFCALLVGSLFLLQPAWFSWIPRLVPQAKVKKFLESAILSATEYSSNRMALVIALGCAVFGQLTTFVMYTANAYALNVTGPTFAQILAAAAFMTLGTFVLPSASGEGVREISFVALLSPPATAAQAFLIGHLGFWIEKLPLSVPGGIMMMRSPEKITKEELIRRREEAMQKRAAAQK